MKTLTTAIFLSLSFFAMPTAVYSQKNGEAQIVIVDVDKHNILKFTNPDVYRQRCSFLVASKAMNNQEEAFLIRVAHLHNRYRPTWGTEPELKVGGPESAGVSLPEHGWLYITASRIIFVVKEGDKSHGFDLPRTALKDKPVTSLQDFFPAGIQINLKERLAASDSREQKFVFLMTGDRNCQEALQPKPYTQFIKHAINDFAGALAEFKQLATALTQSGKIQQAQVAMMPSGDPSNLMTDSSSAAVASQSSNGADQGVLTAITSVADAQTGRMDQAKANAEKALELLKNPSDTAQFYARGMVHEVLGNLDMAIADFDKALQLDPQRAPIYRSRGNVYKRKNDNERALADFDKAIQLDPKDTHALAARAGIYHDKGDYERAIIDFTNVVELAPKDPQFYLHRAKAYYSKGAVDRALIDADTAVQLGPQNVAAYNLRGFIYAIQDQTDRAFEDFNKAIEIDPRNDYAYYNRGKAYYLKKNYDGAIDDLTRAIELNPERTEIYYFRGVVFLVKGDNHDRAIADFDKAIQLNPRNVANYVSRAAAYFGKGDYQQAVVDNSEAIRLQPDYILGYQNRAQAYEKMGDKAKAQADRDKVAELEKQKARQ